MRRGWVAALVAASLVLAGCAIPEIPYDRETAGKIHHIGLVTPRFPPNPMVFLASSPGRSFGLIGALVDAGIREDQEGRFGKLLQQQNFAAEEVFVQTLVAGLRAQGYEVSTVPIKRDKAEFAKDYPSHEPPAVDAYLDLVVGGYGYIAAGVGGDTPWRPFFAVRARLVRAADQAVLMQDTVVYNRLGGSSDKIVTIAPDPAVQFSNFNTLEADPAGAVAGLRGALEQSAQTVGTLLR